MAQQNQPSPGVVAHALAALGAHIGEHELANPGQIEVASDAVVINVAGSDARSWRQSIVVDTISRDGVPGGAVEYVVLDGRLPASGVRVRVEYLRRSPSAGRVTAPRAARLAVAR
jgi:hypothetical protein